MDIALLSRIIKELILRNDRVGLPGMGTFVAEMIPASFSDKGYTVNPPYRRLSFFAAKLEEDLLVDFYAKSNDIDRSAAKTYIEHFVKDLKTVLLDRKTVVMPELGRLRVTKDNTFFFVPNEDLDIFPEGFSLPPVSLKTHVETPEEIAISISNLANIVDGRAEAPLDPLPEDDALAEPLLIEPDDSDGEHFEPLPGVDLPEIAPDPELQPLPGVNQPEPAPETELHPEPVPQQPESEPEPTPAPEPLHEPLPEPDSHPAPSPVSVPQTAMPAMPARSPKPVKPVKPKKKCRWWLPIVLALCVAFILLALFLVLASVAPDFVDSLLYTPEELRIINY